MRKRKRRDWAGNSGASVIRSVSTVFGDIVISLAVVIAVALLGVRIFGFTPFAILSGSMTPTYYTGDMVYVKKCNPLLIKKGDVITFVADENLTLVTHRVIGIDVKERMLQTKGDANDSPDPKPVLMANVVGTVRFSIPKLGYLANFLSATSGKYTAAAMLLSVILILYLPELIKEIRTADK